MKSENYNAGPLVRKILYTAFFVMCTVGVWAQDTTKTRMNHGVQTFETAVRNATVVYVEGNDLVLKLEDGKVEHLIVPGSDRFTIDGKVVSVNELKVGTRLTQSITTTTTPHYVNTVRVLKGKVWHVNPPTSVIVSLPDGKNHRYIVPGHAKFTVNGQPKTVFDLRKGMTFEATIITDSPGTIMSKSTSVVGQAPTPALPPVVGVLLVQPYSSQTELAATPEDAPAPTEVADAEPSPVALPKTGSPLPLGGLLGAVAVALSLGMGRFRKRLDA